MAPVPDDGRGRAPHRLDEHWLRSIVFTFLLVGLVAGATGTHWTIAVASVCVSTVGFGFFYLVFAGGAHFGLVVANFVAIYGCLFEFFRDANFGHAPRLFVPLALALPVAGFLLTCFVKRHELAHLIRARRLRQLEQLPRIARWLMASMAVGAWSFVMPHLNPTPMWEGIALVASMALITLFVVVATRDVILLMIDVAIVFEMVTARLDRLLMPLMAFLTFYGLLVIVFACLYRIADLTSHVPQFMHNGEPHRLRFVDALYYSIVTITTVGFGDFSPNSLLTRALTGLEVVSGVLMLLFGFSEIMRSAGPDSPHRPPASTRHDSA